MNRNLLLIVGVVVLALVAILGMFFEESLDVRELIALTAAGCAACFASAFLGP